MFRFKQEVVAMFYIDISFTVKIAFLFLYLKFFTHVLMSEKSMDWKKTELKKKKNQPVHSWQRKIFDLNRIHNRKPWYED